EIAHSVVPLPRVESPPDLVPFFHKGLSTAIAVLLRETQSSRRSLHLRPGKSLARNSPPHLRRAPPQGQASRVSAWQLPRAVLRLRRKVRSFPLHDCPALRSPPLAQAPLKHRLFPADRGQRLRATRASGLTERSRQELQPLARERCWQSLFQ